MSGITCHVPRLPQQIFTTMGLDRAAQRAIFYGNGAALYLKEEEDGYVP